MSQLNLNTNIKDFWPSTIQNVSLTFLSVFITFTFSALDGTIQFALWYKDFDARQSFCYCEMHIQDNTTHSIFASHSVIRAIHNYNNKHTCISLLSLLGRRRQCCIYIECWMLCLVTRIVKCFYVIIQETIRKLVRYHARRHFGIPFRRFSAAFGL